MPVAAVFSHVLSSCASGGYNIKAGAGSMIELMKFDMGGAGATLGAAKAIGAIQPAGIEVLTDDVVCVAA